MILEDYKSPLVASTSSQQPLSSPHNLQRPPLCYFQAFYQRRLRYNVPAHTSPGLSWPRVSWRLSCGGCPLPLRSVSLSSMSATTLSSTRSDPLNLLTSLRFGSLCDGGRPLQRLSLPDGSSPRRRPWQGLHLSFLRYRNSHGHWRWRHVQVCLCSLPVDRGAYQGSLHHAGRPLHRSSQLVLQLHHQPVLTLFLLSSSPFPRSCKGPCP